MYRLMPLLIGVACTGGPERAEIVELAVTELYPGVAEVTVSTSAAAAVTLSWGPEGEPLDRSAELGPGTEHRLELRGLRLGTTTTIEASVGEAARTTTLSVSPPRADLPVMVQEAWDPDVACTSDRGFVLTSMLRLDGSPGFVVIYDHAGQPVWAWASDPDEWLARARVGRDGDSLLWLHNDPTRVDDVGRITRVGFDGEVRSETRALFAHHDFVERSDGRLAWLSYTFAEGLEVDGEVRDVATDVILEASEGAVEGEESPVFSMLTDYPHGLYDPGLTRAEESFLPGWWEFSHGNSLMLSEDEGSYYAMFRWLDALVKVDRDGQLQWQLGGAHGDITWAPEEAFNRPHMSTVWDGGFVVFDNADYSVGVSGPAAYALDEQAGTASRTFEYRHPEGDVELLLGDVVPVDREGCGSWLVAWSTAGRIEEITADGQVALALQAPPGWIVSRLTWLPTL